MTLRLTKALDRLAIDLKKVLSSTALRAKTYAQAISDGCQCQLELNQALYTFSSTQLLGELRKLPEQLDSVAVVGHNPALTRTVNRLARANIDNVPTSAFIILRCNVDTWDNIISDPWPLSADQKLNNTEHKILAFNFPKQADNLISN
jgi:phosphohistidine phosphatase